MKMPSRPDRLRPKIQPLLEDAQPAASARTVDEADLGRLPDLERLTPIESRDLDGLEVGLGHRRRSPGDPLDAQARIIQDEQDGAPVYARPPVRPHPIGRLARLRGRARPPARLLAVIALVNAASVGLDAMHRTALAPDMIVDVALRVGTVLALGLLPAAVLVWRPDAWRSARMLLVGAMLWGLAPAYFGLAWLVVRHFPGPYAAIGPQLTAALAVASAAACVAPAIMAFGLARVRHARAADFGYLLPRVGLVTVFLMGLSASQWGYRHAAHVLPAAMPGDPAPLLVSVLGTMLPVQIASVALLAYVCLSAVADSASQTRFWQLSSAGVLLLGLVGAWELASFQLLGNSWLTGTGGEWSLAVAAARASGCGLLLLGFGTPAWSLARDAEPGLGAPEEVFAWGSAADITGEAQVPIGAVVMVSAGADHALALDDLGRVAAWGENGAGQADVPAGLAGVMSVAAGDKFSLALRSDGSVSAWGANDHGQAEPPLEVGSVIAICAGSDFGLALRSDGTISAWGNQDSPAVGVPPDLRDVVAIAAGRRHALALRSDGTVAAWGDNESGQLRLPHRLAGVTAIAAGSDFSLALLPDRTVVAWGDNRYGQLDVPPSLRDVAAIAAGAFHGVALRDGGDVVSWGSGRITGEGLHPWRLLDFRAVAAGHEYSLAIKAA